MSESPSSGPTGIEYPTRYDYHYEIAFLNVRDGLPDQDVQVCKNNDHSYTLEELQPDVERHLKAYRDQGNTNVRLVGVVEYVKKPNRLL